MTAETVARPVIVGLVQITEPVDQFTYLPYSVGLLQAYAKAHAADPARYLFLLPQFQREAIEQAVARLALAQIVGLSLYVWNEQYSLALAQALKQARPQTLIVLGGPQVPDQPAEFLARYPFVDVCVHGEGEKTFLGLLEAWPGGDLGQIPGLSYRDPAGQCLTQARAPRIEDLEQIPSPFLSGVFEPLMLSRPDVEWAAIWETNRGCPFSCTFCDWGSNIASKVRRFGPERLEQEMAWFGRQRIPFVFCADANFGILPRDLEISHQLVASSQAWGFPRRIITQMTKNQMERAFEVHRILWDGGLLISATLSLQSVTPEVLTAIKRDNISLPAYQQLLRRFVAAGVPTYTDVLIGLPGESFESFLAGVDQLIQQGQHDEMRFWNAYLLPNAEMASAADRQRYGIESVKVPYFPPYAAVAGPTARITEAFEMIVATASLARADWIRTRALAWMIQTLYYGKLLQLPLMLIQALTQLSYQQLLMAFFEDPLPEPLPVIQHLRQFLHQKAVEVSQGQPESTITPNPATGEPVWLPTHIFLAAQLLYSPRLGDFYRECRQVLEALLQRTQQTLPPDLLSDALDLARALFVSRRDPQRRMKLSLSYNLWSCYQQIRLGQPIQLESGCWQVSQAMDAMGHLSVLEQTGSELK